MPIIEIENEQHWHELRSGCIGASEIGALFDEGHPFTTPHAIWSRLKGLLPGIESHPLMERGKEMEPLIARNIERMYGIKVMKANQYHIHPIYQWLGCTLDYYILEHEDGPAGLQIKNVVHGDKYTPLRGPDYVEFQVQAEMFIANAARVALGKTPFTRWFLGFERYGNPEDCHLVERQPIPGVVKAIVDTSTRFMEQLNSGGEPMIDNPRDYDHIRAMFLKYGIRNDEVLDLADQSGSVEDIIEQWEAAKISARKEADRLATVKTRLLRQCMVIDGDDVNGYMRAETMNKCIHISNSNGLRVEVTERKR